MLTDSGIALGDLRINRTGPSRQLLHNHILDRASSEHPLTKPSRPWTKGRAERMERKIKDATVKSSITETWRA